VSPELAVTTVAHEEAPQHPTRREKLGGRLDSILVGSLFIFVAALPVSIAICQSALGVAYLAWIGRMILRRRVGISPTPLDGFFLAYLVVEVLSLIFSQDRWRALIFFRRMLLIPIVYLVAENVRSERRAKALVVTLIGVMAVLGLWGIQKYLQGVGGLTGRLHLRQHSMTSGELLMMVGAFSVAYGLSSAPRRIRLLALLSSIPILIALVFTYTRSAWLGFLGGLITIGLVVNRKVILGTVLAVVLLVAVGPASLRDRAVSTVDPHHPLNIERTYMWRAGLAIIRDYPWTGVGDINLTDIYLRYKPPEATQYAGHLHNNFLMLAATLGIPGCLVVLALFVKIFALEVRILRRAVQASWFLKSTALAALAGFVGFQIVGLFEWNFGDAEIAMLLWFTVGLVLAVDRQFNTEQH